MLRELVAGVRAPDFSLPDESGRIVSLRDFRGRRVVLYFYPEDDTPGCTTQACEFRDSFASFAQAGAVVLGVSPDSVESHARFKAKFSLPFPLLSDPDLQVVRAYGAWGLKNLYGKEVEGFIRSTIVIDADGRVASVHRNVRTEGHARRMLEALPP